MHTLSFVGSHGNLISVTTAGTGMPLMLLHGFPLDHRQWLPQLQQLSSEYRLIAPDLRGFGSSSLPEQPYTMADLADDVEQVRQHLAGGEAIVLCGLSMGGYVAFEYWRRYPHHLRGLVLTNTKPQADTPEARSGREEMCQQARQSGSWSAVSSMLPKLLAAEHLEAGNPVLQATEQMLRASSVSAICAAQQALANRQDFIASLPAIQLPTLVITGASDPIAPPEATRKWAAVMPHSECQVVPSTAHLTPLEAPDTFNLILREYLKTVRFS